MSLSDVSRVLWEERALLETLHYRLDVQRLVIAGAVPAWLPRAGADVEAALEAIRAAEVRRDAAVRTAAGQLGLAATASLRVLAEAAPDPWAGVLTGHRESLLEAVAEITALSGLNRELLTAGERRIRDLLANVAGGNRSTDPDGYTQTGAVGPQRTRPRVLDQVV